MRALLIVNPNATSTTSATRDLLAHALESRTQLTVAPTQRRGHAAELAQWAVETGMDVVVVHGGDGTVNEVVNGMLPAPDAWTDADLTAPRPRLAIIPGGSANVFARSLGIDSDPVVATNDVIDLLEVDTQRTVGLGHADGRWFLFTAGVGLDANVCRTMDRLREKGRTATPGRYLRVTVREFFAARGKEPMLTLELPGREPVSGVHYAMISNSSPWTFLNKRPIVTNPDTSFEKGLGVFAMRSTRVLGTLRVAERLLRGKPPVSKALARVDDVPRVVVRSTGPVGLQMDGDYVGQREVVQFTAVQAALRVIAPKLG
ncbi:MAG: diacylglycerol kinase family lipid kinase [Mycobacteriaceae bacterium]|nr:diacylglycerol kinase family lipid kinase [Mycobacteriaceae bacterium]